MPGQPKLVPGRMAKGEPALEVHASSCLAQLGIIKLGRAAPKEAPRKGKVTESRFI